MTNIAFRQCAECGVHYQSHIETNTEDVVWGGKTLCPDCAAKPEKYGAPDCDFSDFEIKFTYREIGFGQSRKISAEEFFTPDFLQKKIDNKKEAEQLKIEQKIAEELSATMDEKINNGFFRRVLQVIRRK